MKGKKTTVANNPPSFCKAKNNLIKHFLDFRIEK